MTISSSLNAGVTGLNVNASKLATISDNIANSETYGYKRVDSDFSSLVLGARRGSYTAGGVTATSFREVEASGSLISTSNPTDISVGGLGMLPVTAASAVEADNGDLPLMLVTTGSFRRDDDGYLRTPSGLVLMGWRANPDGTIPDVARDSGAGLEPVQIDYSQFATDATTRIELGANLPATATQAGASGDTLEVPVEYFDNLGTSQTISFSFTPSVPATGASNQWRLEIFDEATGPAAIAEFDIAFDDTRGAGGAVASVTPVAGGTYDAATGEISVNVAGGPMSIAVGAPGSPDQLTQLSAEFAPVSITKDGAPVGSVYQVEIDENGILRAIYDTGFIREMYQIPLGAVASPNGLRALSNQAYAISADSGQVYFYNAGDGATGTVIGYALEQSTTDIAGELTQLIQTQRAYSSNAKVIQTVDEMLQETTNIKR